MLRKNFILFSALCASVLVIFISFEYESLSPLPRTRGLEVSFYLSAANFIKPRGADGKFLPGPVQSYSFLNSELLECLYGELLGDGHLRYNKKGKDGLPAPNSNAQFAITLKSKEHIYHLWENIYKEICTSTGPHPWPKPKTGKPVTQYHLASRALPSLSEVHKKWYLLNDKKFVKIVPLNIKDILTARSIAF